MAYNTKFILNEDKILRVFAGCLTLFGALFNTVLAEEFITAPEYAKMLYQNPRGIGCHLCHGERGEGKTIAKYSQKERKSNNLINKELRVPAITGLSFAEFERALKSPRGIMPSYYLTAGETRALYDYLNTK